MSDRDPNPSGRQQFHQGQDMDGTSRPTSQVFQSPSQPIENSTQAGLNPGAYVFQPEYAARMGHQNGGVPHQHGSKVSSQSLLYRLEDRVSKLEYGQEALATDLQDLRMAQATLSQDMEAMHKNGQSVSVDSFKNYDYTEDGKRLDEHKLGNLGTKSGADIRLNKETESNVSIPPHLRVKTHSGMNSMPPHLRTKGVKNALTRDSKVDVPPIMSQPVPAPALTPPPSSPTTITTPRPDVSRLSIEDPYITRSGLGWVPGAIRDLPTLGMSQLSLIPASKDTVTFSYDFLSNNFGGIFWSPGLKYITPSSAPCILSNRCYFLIDAEHEPYLPREPGQHGAKLTAFFNQNPEDVYGDEAQCNFDDVPMFVCSTPYGQGNKKRYVYFGNYSQPRWSDKLDYDHMVEQVPNSVKEFWAEELSSNGRDQWVSEALMKHFFPKPEYEGRLFGEQPEGSVAPEEEAEMENKIIKDVKEYVRELNAWEKDAKLKTQLIKKEFIMQAFERVSTTFGSRVERTCI